MSPNAGMRPSEKIIKKRIATLSARTTSETQVFAMPVMAAVSRHMRPDGLPLFLAQSINFLDSYHLDTEGLYRIPGSKLEIDYFRAHFDSKTPVRFERWVDSSTVTSLILLFLRECPGSVFTERAYNELRQIKNVSESERKDLVKGILATLPKPNLRVVATLMFHLRRVADNEEKTLMTSATIATCIMAQQAGNVKVMIDYCDELFTEGKATPVILEEDVTIPSSKKKQNCVIS